MTPRMPLAILAVVLCLLPVVANGPAVADEPGRPAPAASTIEVPAMQGFSLAQARSILKRRGLDIGTVYGMSRERIYAYLQKYYSAYPDKLAYARKLVYQRVFVHSPQPKARVSEGSTVDIVLVSRGDGPLPPQARFRDLVVRALPPASVQERRAAEAESPRPRPERSPSVPRVSAAEPAPVRAPRSTPAEEAATSDDDETTGAGSPDAPRVAPAADPSRVPSLLGLDLNDAEQLARDSEMTLYVERVAGHPIGRVLAQAPSGGAARPPGGVVKVRITAGGDFEAELPGAPEVLVEHVSMPDLLDRTRAQAERILDALGLAVQVLEARRGLVGRVVDQNPDVGARVHKGHAVRVWIGPGALPPAPTGPSIGPSRGETAPAPEPSSAREGGGDAPQPIAPTDGTSLPADALITIGFSWRAVEGADAYLVEVEEATAQGGWVAGARRRVKRTAAMLDLERLDERHARAFRWRVRAIRDGREGRASGWIVLR